MPDPNPSEFDAAADKSVEAGIADESAAYDKAMKTEDAPPSIDEGDPRTTDDGSGTSETD